MHVHKICGFICLAHFVYRFYCGAQSDMGFVPSTQTMALLMVHVLLSYSSLIFKLPLKRIKHGIRIWPEFRLHSIIFASRYLLVLFGLWIELRMQGADESPKSRSCWSLRWWTNVAFVFGSMRLAEKATEISNLRNGKHAGCPSNSVRGIDAPKIYKYIFSVFQFHETATVLLSTFVPLFCIPFGMLFVIQFTAFGMTLQRKNLVPHKFLTHVYMVELIWFVLLMPALAIQYSTPYFIGMIQAHHIAGNFAAVMRMWFLLGKYQVWLVVSAAILLVSSCLSVEQLKKLGTPVCCLSWMAVGVVGLLKVNQKRH